jgi:hypothetical protein
MLGAAWGQAISAAQFFIWRLQGLTSKYEVLAGRSAMLGTTVAVLVESLTEESLIDAALSPSAFAALAAAACSVAIALAGAPCLFCLGTLLLLCSRTRQQLNSDHRSS